MAEWPPAGMNNFGHPGFDYVIETIGPPTLVTEYEDGTTDRREKIDIERQRVTENWQVNRTDMAVIMEFFRAKGTADTFTRLLHDPRSGTSFATDEGTFRFLSAPQMRQVGPQWYDVTVQFIQEL
jgi:hypothetical protein